MCFKVIKPSSHNGLSSECGSRKSDLLAIIESLVESPPIKLKQREEGKEEAGICREWSHKHGKGKHWKVKRGALNFYKMLHVLYIDMYVTMYINVRV